MTVEPLTTKQEQAILALMTEPSVAKAAASIDVGERTLYEWLRQPVFRNEYHRARRDAFGQAIGLLQKYSAMAVHALAKDPVPTTGRVARHSA